MASDEEDGPVRPTTGIFDASAAGRPTATMPAGSDGNIRIPLGGDWGSAAEVRLAGEVTLEWSCLDYCLRIAAKRLCGLSIESPEAHGLMSERSHRGAMEKLKDAIDTSTRINAEERATLLKMWNEIGITESSHRESLFARRNVINHSVWAYSSSGDSVRRRVGTDEWRFPAEIDQRTLDALRRDLRRTWRSLLELTERLVR